MENAHIQEPAACLSYFSVSENTGLSPDQVKRNLDKFGYNGEGHVNTWMYGWMDGWMHR